MAYNEKKKKSNAAHESRAYDHILYRAKKGYKADILAAAARDGLSVNGLIDRAVRAYVDGAGARDAGG